MMNAKLALTLALAALLLSAVLLLPTTARGQPTGFIISNADAISYVTTTASSQLNTLMGDVAPRFVVQYANGMRYYTIPPISSTLMGLLAQVGDRFVIQYANANRFHGFTYPAAMIGDTAPPLIATPPTMSLGADGATISWLTNEYATTLFKYGTQSGVYAQVITDTQFYKLHQFTLTGLMQGQRYYYRIQHADRSGNAMQSQEYNFVASYSVFLPLLRK